MVEMINDRKSSDMSIKCKDNVSISASRLQLMSGSSKLKEIINREIHSPAAFQFFPRDVNIHLPSITSTTLHFILEYLYTGEMFHRNGWQMKTVQQGVDILRASRDLDLKLEPIVKEHLIDKISNAKDISKAALELSASVELGVRASASSPDLVKLLKKADLTPAHLRLLSLKAFEHYLEDTKRSHHVDQYTRFRQIILWCITQVRPNDPDDKIAALLPDQRRAMALLERNSLADGVNLRYLESLGEARRDFDDLMRGLLRQIELWGIDRQLLSDVVEPLKVVSQADITRAFAQRPARPSSKWVHGSGYRSEGDGGFTIAKCEPRTGLATYRKPISGDSGVYEWAVTVLELCDDFCEIGFHKDEPTRDIGTLAGQPVGFSLRSTAAGRESEVNRVHFKGDKWQAFKGNFAHRNSSVKFKLDMEQRTCMICVGNGKYELGWEALPKTSTFYPAVSLGTGKHGKVRIELIRGFKGH